MLIPSYGFCPIPPCEEFAENVCDEFFSLPIFPQYPTVPCDSGTSNCTCGGALSTLTGSTDTILPVTNCTNLCGCPR